MYRVEIIVGVNLCECVYVCDLLLKQFLRKYLAITVTHFFALCNASDSSSNNHSASPGCNYFLISPEPRVFPSTKQTT